MKNRILEEKSFCAAKAVVKFSKVLFSRNEYDLGRQLLRSGTSVGANIREASRAESDLDFIHKLSVAQKECEETLYWLELLLATEIILKDEFDYLFPLHDEVMRLLVYSIMKVKNKT